MDGSVRRATWTYDANGNILIFEYDDNNDGVADFRDSYFYTCK